MNEFNIIFYGLYITLVSTPIVAFILRRRFQKQTKLILYSTATLAVLVVISALTGFSIYGVSADFLVLYILYLLAGVCVFKLTAIKNRPAKAVGIFGVIILVATPFLFVPAVLAVALIASDFEPRHTKDYRQNYLCRVTTYGNATTATGGYSAHFYKTFLIVEHEIYSKRVENTRKPEITADKACDIAFEEFKVRKKEVSR